MKARMTSQREIILTELQRLGRHMTADELYTVVRKKMPRISLATVYRNLEFLAESGMIARLEVSGRQKRFDHDIHQHDHICCVQCGKIENILMEKKEADSASQVGADGYIITGRRLEFAGVCPDCQKNNKRKKGDDTMACGCEKKGLSDEQKKVLQALEECKGPCASKDIAAATGLDSKVVSCRLTDLKKKGFVESPERCRYGITAEGRTAMKG